MELLVFIHNLCKKENQLQPPGEPREHRLGEVLQGRSKSNFNIILSFFLQIFLRYLSSSVIFFQFRFPKSKLFRNKRSDLKIPGSNVPKYLNCKLSNLLKSCFLSLLRRGKFLLQCPPPRITSEYAPVGDSLMFLMTGVCMCALLPGRFVLY